MNGYVTFYVGISKISKIIKFFTWAGGDGPSHAAFERGNGQVIEAWHKGGVREVVSRDHGHTPGTKIIRFKIEGMTVLQEERMVEFMLNQLRKKYDWWGIASFIRRKVWHRDNAWFCSELVFAAAKHVGIDLLARIEPYKVSPALLFTSPLLIKIDEVITRDPE